MGQGDSGVAETDAGKCRGQCHHAAGLFIVRLFDCGECEGSPFLVMEYVEGETLSDFLDRVGHVDESEADYGSFAGPDGKPLAG